MLIPPQSVIWSGIVGGANPLLQRNDSYLFSQVFPAILRRVWFRSAQTETSDVITFQNLIVGTTRTAVSSPDSVNWTVDPPLPMLGNALSILWISDIGKWIATGDSGAINYSNDGVSWFAAVSGTAQFLTEIAWSSPLSLAAVSGNAGTILTSPDGITWTPRTFGVANLIEGIAWGAGLFVAACTGGVIRTSPNGATWSPQVSGVATNLTEAYFGNGFFIVPGQAGTLLTSPDGITWTARTSGTANILRSASFGAGLYVVVGDGGTIRTSPDLITWSARTSGTILALNGIRFTPQNEFVVCGVGGTILTSPDGITWTPQVSGTAETLIDVDARRITTPSVGSIPSGINIIHESTLRPAASNFFSPAMFSPGVVVSQRANRGYAYPPPPLDQGLWLNWKINPGDVVRMVPEFIGLDAYSAVEFVIQILQGPGDF